MESYEQRVRESFARQEMMQTLGAEMSDGAQRGYRNPLSLRRRRSRSSTAIVHAGAVTTVLDSACGYAA